MAKFSKKMMGKEVGDAAVYATPHTEVREQTMTDPTREKAGDIGVGKSVSLRVSLGDPAADNVKTTGIKIRGTGAATKGVMARGPMA